MNQLVVNSRVRIWIALAVILSGIAGFRVIATYPVFSQAYDEPMHIAAGMEWLDRGSYLYEPKHPPLPRVALALGPYLKGVRLSESQHQVLKEHEIADLHFGNKKLYKDLQKSGNEILGEGESYLDTLAAARAGNLPFLLLALIATWMWTRIYSSHAVAAIAVLLVSSTPVVLGQASIATTDMSLVGTLLLAFYMWRRWLLQPNSRNSLLVGITWALAAMSKISSVLFLPTGALAIWAAYIWDRYRDVGPVVFKQLPIRDVARGMVIIVCAGVLVVWALFRFSLTPLVTAEQRPHEPIDAILGSTGTLHELAYTLVESPLPLVEVVKGVAQAANQNTSGHVGYLLGEVSRDGWWYYYLVELLVRTPIALMVLAGFGLVHLFRTQKKADQYIPLLLIMTALLVTFPSSINNGVRHILYVYPFMAIIAALGAASLWNGGLLRQKAGRLAVIFLIGWQVLDSFNSHPDYMPYFNEFARSAPEELFVDSDLDSGQDLQRLARYTQEHDIEQLWLSCLSTADINAFDFQQVRPLPRHTPVSGWVAISMFRLKDVWGEPPYDGYAWLSDFEPEARIGKSIFLYRIPEQAVPANTGPTPVVLDDTENSGSSGLLCNWRDLNPKLGDL